MDVIGLIVQGAISGSLSVGVGLIGAYFGLKWLESRAKAAANQFIVEEVTAFLKLVHEKPEMFAPVANGFLNDLTKIIQIPNIPGIPNLPSGEGIQALIPMLPRKWRGPAMLASMFMGKDDKPKQTSNQHPFAQ